MVEIARFSDSRTSALHNLHSRYHFWSLALGRWYIDHHIGLATRSKRLTLDSLVWLADIQPIHIQPKDIQPMDIQPTGHPADWTSSRLDFQPTGHPADGHPADSDIQPTRTSSQKTSSRLDIQPTGHPTNWTSSRLDIQPTRTSSRLGHPADLDIQPTRTSSRLGHPAKLDIQPVSRNSFFLADISETVALHWKLKRADYNHAFFNF